MQSQKALVRRNIVGNNRVARLYDDWHPEIFTEIEQSRLRQSLGAIRGAFDETPAPAALDFGSGSGNVTRHLVELGFETTSADVAERFLAIVEERWGDSVRTVKLNGKDLSALGDSTFDLIALYSVLHHLPDYLQTISDLVRRLRPGGILYLDHEVSEGYWRSDATYEDFLTRVAPQEPPRKKTFRRFLKPSNYVNALRQKYYQLAGYTDQGDIHVFPEDHVEWSEIRRSLERRGLSVVLDEDYLLYRGHYDVDVYEQYRSRCADVHVLAMRAPSEQASAELRDASV